MAKMIQIIYCMRPRQWIKNAFVFLPLIFGKQLLDTHQLLSSTAAFLLFSVAAGAVYILNDIVDYHHDKNHPTKKLKPICSGKVSMTEGTIACVILSLMGVLLAFLVNAELGYILITYILCNILYSKVLKHIVIVDVFCIALFFWLRLIAGSVVTDISLSTWLMIMASLLALFLGFNKRRQELKYYGKNKSVKQRSVLEKYNAYFIDQMISVITASILVSYLLYTIDPKTVANVGSHHLIYSTPFVYYGVFRYLYIIHQLSTDGDPTRLLLKDRPMQINLALWLGTCILCIYFI